MARSSEVNTSLYSLLVTQLGILHANDVSLSFRKLGGKYGRCPMMADISKHEVVVNTEHLDFLVSKPDLTRALIVEEIAHIRSGEIRHTNRLWTCLDGLREKTGMTRAFAAKQLPSYRRWCQRRGYVPKRSYRRQQTRPKASS